MLHGKTLGFLIAGTVLSTVLPSSAYASSVGANVNVVNPGLQFPEQQRVSYASSLSNITAEDSAIKARILDWRKPVLELSFDLSEADYTDHLELLLTADPLGSVDRKAPIIVQFNNDRPQRINTRGQGFDARVKLNAAKMRARRNIIRLTYDTPAGADCVTPEHGGWLVDLKNSKLAIKGRAKSRALQLREVEMRLNLEALAPRRVGVIAKGTQATDLQALAAQAVGLRMQNLPNFTTQPGKSDFEIIMVRRDQLHPYTSDEKLLNGSGPRVYVPRGRPMRLILTADTDKELLEVVRSFATYELPKARRQITSLGEIQMQSRLDANTMNVAGTKKLSDISGTNFTSGWKFEDWANGPQTIRFSVEDPAATSGDLVLSLATNKDIAPSSSLHVALNSQALGSAKLDKRRKKATFKIRPGVLHGGDNVLTLTPELEAKTETSCAANTKDAPSFYLGQNSKLILRNELNSPITELSRLAANGAPFSDNQGTESYIALPERASDYNASLRIIAKMAKANGQGLTRADYERTSSLSNAGDRHALFLNRSNALDPELRKAAPVAFDKALRGQAINGDNLLGVAYGDFASANTEHLFQQFAANYSKAGRVRAGGIATLFASPQHKGKVIGVITNTPGQSFTTAASYLVQDDHWNQMEGGVARWNSKSMLLAQTAKPVPEYNKPAGSKRPAAFDKIANFELPSWTLPNSDDLEGFFASASTSIKSAMSSMFAKFNKAPQYTSLNTDTTDPKATNLKRSAIDQMWETTNRKAAVLPIRKTHRLQGDTLPKLRGPISAPINTQKTKRRHKQISTALEDLKTWSIVARSNIQNWIATKNIRKKTKKS